ncbi:MAG TPA: OsmC family protein [Gemmatimonadaceae bacterium]|nr:OsmC family protein [Gemmatimonadaceae bacterium]
MTHAAQTHTPRMHGAHEYAARLVWDGNTGNGTSSYTGYSRRYHVRISGKPDLAGTADPAFRGEADMHNPEDLFLASLSACHMLSYLALCARHGVRVLAYEDDATGVLNVRADGGGRFESVMLRPRVIIQSEEHIALAMQLHDAAHDLCFIASSCSIPVRHEPTVQTGSSDTRVHDILPSGADDDDHAGSRDRAG